MVIVLLVTISCCSFFKKKKEANKDVIARVNDEYLYTSDLQPLTKGLKGKDSTEVLKNYSENWIRKKLLLQKAIENIPEDDLGITKKVEDYRQTLLLYEYEKALINKRLDTVITQKELNDWYEKLKNDLSLEKDVYQLFFIKLKKDAKDIDEARKWIMKPKDEEDLRKLDGYCKEFATSYVMDQGIWYDKENVLKNFPLTENDIAVLSSTKTFKEFKTESGTWFVRIPDAVKRDQPAPLQFVHDQVVKFIIEKRRQQLVEKIYDKIYQDGIKAKSFEIFVK
ncbi:MAG: hypothetical protein JWO06_1593 [Bacteroidota bacterium]|nr:hypothetical protein [Bacteroidota bacterium]